MIEGISHITLVVRDLEKMSHFLKEIFNAEMVYDSGEKSFSLSKERFFLINGLWIAIMEGNALQEKSYNHIAFKVAKKDFEWYVDKVSQLGFEVKIGRKRIDGEAESLYFYDDDHHLFEIHTGTLEERLERYKNYNQENS